VARAAAPESRRVRLGAALDRRIRGLLHLGLVFSDALMLSIGFMLGYVARARLPLPALPVNPPSFTSYLPMMLVHVVSILLVFYMARMYHQRRAVSRIDESYAVAQNVSIGTFLAIAVETLAFKNSALELDYPRGVIIYAWVFGIGLTILGREAHRQMVIRLRDWGLARDNVLLIAPAKRRAPSWERIRWSPHLGYNSRGYQRRGGLSGGRYSDHRHDRRPAGRHRPLRRGRGDHRAARRLAPRAGAAGVEVPARARQH